MPSFLDNSRRPLDLSPAQRKEFTVDRHVADRGSSQPEQQEREPAAELPFEWPEEYREEITLLERSTDAEGNPLRFKERSSVIIHKEKITLRETPYSLITRTTTQPIRWERYADTNLQQLRDPDGAMLGGPSLARDGTLVVARANNTLLLQTPDGRTTILKDKKRLAFPSLAPDGTLVIQQHDNTLLLRTPDGKTTMLEDPLGKKLHYPSFAPDGTLIAEREGGTLLLRKQSGATTIITDPEGVNLSHAFLAPDGTLIAERAHGSLLLCTRNRKTTILEDTEYLFDPTVAPDGTIIARRGNGLVLRKPDGTITILEYKDGDEYNRIFSPSLTPNGTIIAKMSDRRILVRTPDGTTTTLQCPEQQLVNPYPMPDGSLIIEEKDGSLIRANPKRDRETPIKTPPTSSPRRTF